MMATMMKTAEQAVVVIGKESTGKSQLVSALTGRRAYASNFRGATVACETYRFNGRAFVDTPGIVRQSDTATTRAALEQVADGDVILLVVQATHIDDDLSHLLPLARGKRGAVVVTFWDKVEKSARATQALDRLGSASGLKFIPVDARRISGDDRRLILEALDEAGPIPDDPVAVRAGWRIEPARTILEVPYLGPVISIALLLAPAIAAIWVANTLAELMDPAVKAVLAPVAGVLAYAPSPLKEILVGDYGLVTMGPLLFVWAVPTIVLYALFLGCYKASGLLDRVSASMHPVMRPFGLSGRDLLRVIMGFGCNVPAVVSTRACSSCSRSTCISAIAFGSACSYQFGATLAVFSAAGLSWLVVPYILFLTTTTLVYVRLISPEAARSSGNAFLLEGRTFLEWPRWTSVWRESRGTVVHFFQKAIPIFLGITVIASILGWLGVIAHVAGILGPLMGVFGLPAEAAVPVVLASIRKDGILLFAEKNTLAALSPGQILTGVYLAGVLLPCLVTALTIAREQSSRFVLGLMGRQALAACVFTLILRAVVRLFGW